MRRAAAITLVALVFCGMGRFELRAGSPQDPEQLKKELPRLPPTEPKDAAKTFRLGRGFRIELVAAEPLVASPVDMAFDEDGRLWVVEMIDYPFGEVDGRPPQGRVRLLEDTKGDGCFDKSTVFADHLSWPTGLALWAGGVFVAAAPHIYYFKDMDGDHKADRQEIVFTGFGNQHCQGLLNNIKWGIDNWFYGASAGNGGSVRSRRKPEIPDVSVRGRDFRFRPTGEIEALSGGGQFGHSLDDFGRRFVCSNSNQARHIVLEDRYLKRNPHLPVPAVTLSIASDGESGTVFRESPPEPWRVARTRLRLAGQAKGPIEHGGKVTGYFTAGVGITVYRGTALGAEYYGNLFIGEAANNLIHRKTLTPEGVTFGADRADKDVEFLASTDNWFRPVNMSNGPDGALYVCDMYREIIEGPQFIPEAIRQHLDVTSGKDRGRIWRVVEQDASRPYEKPRLGKATTAELVAALERPDAWWRETASRLLFQRQDKSAVGLLEKLVSDAALPESRGTALWALDGLGLLRPEIVGRALKDRSAGVREQAAILSRPEALFGLEDADARVRLQIAYKMGETDDPRAIDTLARLAKGADVWLRTAILSSASRKSVELLRRLASSDEIATTLALTIGARNDAAEVSAALELERRAPTVLRGLGDGLSRGGRSLASLPGAKAMLEEAAQTALDEKAEMERRVEAVRLLGYGTFEAAERCLPRFLDPRRPQPLQAAAVRALTAFREPNVGTLLLTSWRTLSPQPRRDALSWFSRPERQAALLGALEKGQVARGDLSPDLRKDLLSNKALADRARKLLGDEAAGDRRKVIDAYQAALGKQGEAIRGKEVFQKNCMSCHKANGEGQEVGPDLATVKSRSPEELLVHILDSNLEVNPQYLNYKILTTGGQVLDGIIASETATSVTLKRAQGETNTVLRENIEKLVSSGVSLMPEGLEKAIDHQQMADLIAFIRAIGEK